MPEETIVRWLVETDESCNLIRNDINLRWRGRYNEDTDLSLRMLKEGWVTVQTNSRPSFSKGETPKRSTKKRELYPKAKCWYGCTQT